MTDTNKYKSVAVRHSTDNQLKDLSAVNETPISKSAMVSYLVDKEWRKKVTSIHKPKRNFFKMLFLGLRKSEVKSNDNW